MPVQWEITWILVTFFEGHLVSPSNPEARGSNPAGGGHSVIFFFFFQIHHFCNIYAFLTLFSNKQFSKTKNWVFRGSLHCFSPLCTGRVGSKIVQIPAGWVGSQVGSHGLGNDPQHPYWQSVNVFSRCKVNTWLAVGGNSKTSKE